MKKLTKLVKQRIKEEIQKLQEQPQPTGTFYVCGSGPGEYVEIDLPYDEEIYCEQGKFTLTKKKHAEDIGVYRFTVKFDYGRCDSDYRYNPDGDYWINVWEI